MKTFFVISFLAVLITAISCKNFKKIPDEVFIYPKKSHLSLSSFEPIKVVNEGNGLVSIYIPKYSAARLSFFCTPAKYRNVVTVYENKNGTNSELFERNPENIQPYDFGQNNTGDIRLIQVLGTNYVTRCKPASRSERGLSQDCTTTRYNSTADVRGIDSFSARINYDDEAHDNDFNEFSVIVSLIN